MKPDHENCYRKTLNKVQIDKTNEKMKIGILKSAKRNDQKQK